MRHDHSGVPPSPWSGPGRRWDRGRHVATPACKWTDRSAESSWYWSSSSNVNNTNNAWNVNFNNGNVNNDNKNNHNYVRAVRG